MSCDQKNRQIAEIIDDALRYAGNTSNAGVNDGYWTKKALRICNNVLNIWSSIDLTNFFVNSVEFDSNGGSINFVIGKDLTDVATTDQYINTEHFNTITSLVFVYAGMQYVVKFEPQKSYYNGTYIYGSALPGIYTYEVYKDRTVMKILPQPFAGIRFIINGKQFIEDVNLLSSDTSIPQYAELPLTYQIARELVNMGAGQPQADFYTNYDKIMTAFRNANKQDEQYEIRPALAHSSAGRGYGFGILWTGYNNGSF